MADPVTHEEMKEAFVDRDRRITNLEKWKERISDFTPDEKQSLYGRIGRVETDTAVNKALFGWILGLVVIILGAIGGLYIQGASG